MFKFTLKQLRYVEAAGRLGSIAKAADELSISQSSITTAIDAIETHVEYDLFIRTPAKGIQVTALGEETLKLIRNYIDDTTHFANEIQSMQGADIGSIRIACYVTAAPAFLPPILKSFKKNYPNVSLRLLEGNMETVQGFLEDGKADLAFTYLTSLEKNFKFIPLFKAPPFAVVSANDAYAKKSFLTLEEICQRPMVMLDLPLVVNYHMSLFSNNGLKPTIVHSSRSSEMIRALVSAGFGISILNIVPRDYREGISPYTLVPIKNPSIYESFGIALRDKIRQPKIIDNFINTCLELKETDAFENLTISCKH